ncbi:MAG: peroxiredoxin [Bacteroidetes bacterium]|nr:peroxiredoxin [Bacteroidota bacterium]
MKIRKGDHIPEVVLPDQNGQQISLGDIWSSKTLVLFFYPKDDTPGCTFEACTFRDNYDAFLQAGAEVVGISTDTVSSHKHFSSKYDLPFTLLSDHGSEIRSLFGVSKTLGLFPGRVTFIIDREGVVRHIFNSQLRIKKHISDALRIIEKLNKPHQM